MRLTINGYEVEIKARMACSDRKMNREDTERFLNSISLYASEAVNRFKQMHCYGIADDAKEVAEDIYEYLKSNGAYD